jgi:hypothetical protein
MGIISHMIIQTAEVGVNGEEGYSLPGGEEVVLTTPLQTGHKVIGGGFEIDKKDGTVVVFRSAPDPDRVSWSVGFKNNGTTAAQVSVWGIYVEDSDAVI